MGLNWLKVGQEVRDMHDAEAAKRGQKIQGTCVTPNCGQKLQVSVTPEQLAKDPKVRCPKCKNKAKLSEIRYKRN